MSSLARLACIQLELTLERGDKSMPLGQSTPLSIPLGIAAGIAGGHYAGKAAEAMGCGELGQKIATGVGHWAASSVAGYTINAIGGADVTGGVVTTGQAALGGVVHAAARSAPHPQPST
jgi:hypothetical protein